MNVEGSSAEFLSGIDASRAASTISDADASEVLFHEVSGLRPMALQMGLVDEDRDLAELATAITKSFITGKKAIEMLNIPIKNNKKLDTLLKRIHEHERLNTLWDCANVMAVNRLKISDHGQTHVAIVSNCAIKLLRNLVSAGVTPSIVKDYGMTNDDAEVVVLFGALFHDIGNAVHRQKHDDVGLVVAYPIMYELMEGMYGEKEKQIVLCESMHAMLAHDTSTECNTIEGGVVRVADGLDMKEGRALIGFRLGSNDIHTISALSIKEVTISKNDEKPIHIEIELTNSAGIFQIDNLLKKKIQGSGIEKYISVIAAVAELSEKKIMEKYELGTAGKA